MAAPQNIRELAYLSLVEYAASAWSPWLLHDITKLYRKTTMKKCNRNYHQTASVSNMIDELGWESLESRRKKMNESSDVT